MKVKQEKELMEFKFEKLSLLIGEPEIIENEIILPLKLKSGERTQEIGCPLDKNHLRELLTFLK